MNPGLSQRSEEDAAQVNLNDEALRDQAAVAIRPLLTEILLIPEDGSLVIQLVWEFAGILALGAESKRPPGGSGRARQMILVAGAGFEPAAFRL